MSQKFDLTWGIFVHSEMGEPLVESTLNLYKSVLNTFLPTPQKCHYMFNLRDFAKVIKGKWNHYNRVLLFLKVCKSIYKFGLSVCLSVCIQ